MWGSIASLADNLKGAIESLETDLDAVRPPDKLLYVVMLCLFQRPYHYSNSFSCTPESRIFLKFVYCSLFRMLFQFVRRLAHLLPSLQTNRLSTIVI